MVNGIRLGIEYFFTRDNKKNYRKFHFICTLMVKQESMTHRSISTVSNLSEYTFQTSLKLFLRTTNFFTKFLKQNFTEVKHRKKNYVSNSYFHVYTIIMHITMSRITVYIHKLRGGT